MSLTGGVNGGVSVSGLVPIASDAWMSGDLPGRSTLRFIAPERFKTDTQAVYAPAGNPSNYSGATDWAPYFAALTAYVRTLLLNQEWPDTPTYGWKHAPLAIALQPGMRYVVTDGWDLTGLKCLGLHIFWNGATLVGRYAGGTAMVDMIGSLGITHHGMQLETDSDLQPSIGLLYGMNKGPGSGPYAASDLGFRDTVIKGFYQKAGVYNLCSEVELWSRGFIENLSGTGPAHQIDNRNEIGVAAYTKFAGGMTFPTDGTPVTCVTHTLDHMTWRTQSSNQKGALRLTSSLTDTASVAVGNVRIRNGYFALSGGDTNFHPAVYIQGRVDSLHVDAHFETGIADANYQVSHMGYYDTSNWVSGAIVQNDHRWITDKSFAEKAQLGQSSDKAAITFTGMEIQIERQLGTGLTGTAAPLFDENMSNSKITGVARLGPSTSLLNFNALAGFYGDIYCSLAYSNLALPASSQGRYIMPTGVVNFPLGGAGDQSVDVQKFTAGGTWTKPAGAKLVRVIATGAGGGGGGGPKVATSTACSGGGGGGGADRILGTFDASALTSTVPVTIGAGGTAGAGASSTGAGTDGGAGGNTTFGSYLTAYGGGGGSGGSAGAGSGGGGGGGVYSAGLSASGATGGLGSATIGGATGGSAAAGGSATGPGGAGGAGSAATGAAFVGGTAYDGSGGGGSGAGITSGNVTAAGGNVFKFNGGSVLGGAAGSGSGGGAGSVGASATDDGIASGSGGGGSDTTGSGGNGGAGGVPGGGAGGGGATQTGAKGGDGGVGGRGEITVITSF